MGIESRIWSEIALRDVKAAPYSIVHHIAAPLEPFHSRYAVCVGGRAMISHNDNSCSGAAVYAVDLLLGKWTVPFVYSNRKTAKKRDSSILPNRSNSFCREEKFLPGHHSLVSFYRY